MNQTDLNATPEERGRSRRPYRIGSLMSDTMAVTLFDQEAPVSRHIMERRIMSQIRLAWQVLHDEVKSGSCSMQAARTMLSRIDQWAHGKLSGRHLLTLARDAEEFYPEWVPMMPKLIASMYESVRVARLWSALLNPDALSRLRQAIQSERSSGLP